MTETAMAGASAPALPAGELVGWFEPGSPEWHATRAQGIGGSEIAAVLGLSPYESRFSLWHRKRGEIAATEETPVMYWGKRLEPAVCDEFAIRHPGWQVLAAPTFRAASDAWHIANPDRILIRPDGQIELLEAKTARDATDWGEEGTDEVPVYYRGQCLWYLHALGVRRCHIAVLIAGSDYREYVVAYDEEEALLMRNAGAEFMRTLRANERPSIDGHTATYQAVKELPDGLDDVDVQVPADLRDRYWSALDAAAAAEEEKRAAAGLVLDAIGTGRRAVVGLERVATRTVRNGKTHALQPARNRGTAA